MLEYWITSFCHGLDLGPKCSTRSQIANLTLYQIKQRNSAQNESVKMLSQ